MLIIALTGLHGCGKSAVRNLLQSEHGFVALEKRVLLLELYQAVGATEPFVDWYRSIYIEQGGAAAMQLIWAQFANRAPTGSKIVVDSVHNVDEWKFLHELCANSMLMYVVTAEKFRMLRTDAQHMMLDSKRIGYSHSQHDGLECLFAKADLSICNNYGREDLKSDVRRFVLSLPNVESPDAK